MTGPSRRDDVLSCVAKHHNAQGLEFTEQAEDCNSGFSCSVSGFTAYRVQIKKVSRLQNTKYGLGPQGLRVVFTVPYDSRKPSETLRPSEGHEGVETFSPSGAKTIWL